MSRVDEGMQNEVPTLDRLLRLQKMYERASIILCGLVFLLVVATFVIH